MNYGVTSSGFNTKTYETLLNELFSSWGNSFGAIDTDPDGAFGQLAISLSLTHSQLWNILQTSFANSDPRTASGDHLNKLMAILGLYRKQATPANSTIYLGGTVGTSIPSGNQVTQTSTNKVFEITNSVTISLNNCNRFDFVVTNETVGASVGFLLNGVVIKYTVKTGDSKEIIAEQLKLLVLANSVVCDISSAVVDGEKLTVSAFIPYRGFTVSGVTGGTTPKVWMYSFCQCSETGINITPAKSIDKIKTPLAGWSDVENPINGNSGSVLESDIDFRKRMKKASQMGGAGTEYAIEAKLWNNIRTISNVLVFSNRNDTFDVFGNYPRSVTVVVEGGSDAEVGQALYQCLPCGITTSGDISYTVPAQLTGNSNNTTVNFSRTKLLFGWVRVTILEKNPEEVYPSNAEDLIRASVFNEAVNSIALGNDLIAQKYVGAIYRAVSGLADIKVEVCATGSNTANPNLPYGDFVNTDLSYSSGWKSRVTVAPTDKVEWRDAYNSTRIEVIQ